MIFLSFAISGIILTLSQCIFKDEKAIAITSLRGEQYIGSASCQQCHQTIYNSFLHTAHYNDSHPASKEAIKGSFAQNKNFFLYSFNVNRAVVMEERDSGLYQVAYIDKKEKEAHRFDMVIGSGRKGQSYLYWKENHLFQLPISYFTPTDSWSNSPGFPTYNIIFNRIIDGRCLECHTTYVGQTFQPAAEKRVISFEKNKIIYGIDCERCHGPAAQHVRFHLQHPQEKTAKYIVNPASLSRQQRLDVCALCHSGVREATKPSFSFEPGDTLANYLQPNHTASNNATLDVHGNQYGLLLSSPCYIKSNTLDCSSCHNTHTKEESSLAIYSQKCMNCHKEENHNFCKMASSLGKAIEQNCIDCHMPNQPSKTLTVQNSAFDTSTHAFVRSHLIAIYQNETQKFLSQQKH